MFSGFISSKPAIIIPDFLNYVLNMVKRQIIDFINYLHECQFLKSEQVFLAKNMVIGQVWDLHLFVLKRTQEFKL